MKMGRKCVLHADATHAPEINCRTRIRSNPGLHTTPGYISWGMMELPWSGGAGTCLPHSLQGFALQQDMDARVRTATTAPMALWIRRRGHHGIFAVATWWLYLNVFLLVAQPAPGALAQATTSVKRFNMTVDYHNVTRLCQTKTLVAVNGQFPGPTQYVDEGDVVLVTVTNLVSYNVTIHWHGVRQMLSAWADGPAYVTQCPVQTGQSYTHKFIANGQRGTLFWHAHISWLRATVHGAFIIRPKPLRLQPLYPFALPNKEVTLIFGEWWNSNVEDVAAAAQSGASGYNLSDALTINGQPGDFYNCSASGTKVVTVISGKTYLLRIINAALNFQLWFGVANHTLTVVEADGEYTKQYTTDVIAVAPGQTTNVLLKATHRCGKFYMATFPYSPLNTLAYPEIPATAILKYKEPCNDNSSSSISFPDLPAVNDTARYTQFNAKLRGLNNQVYQMDVPRIIDRNLFFTVGYTLLPCSPPLTCTRRIQGSVNNVTFVPPTISLLQAYYYNITGVYTTDFPGQPPYPFNYTGPAPANPVAESGTRVYVLNFGDRVELILQDQSIFGFENHPFHLHGQSFYIVGTGFGNYNTSLASGFNLVDPPLRNTIGVPSGGWAAIRFRATNPGVWFLHCHIELHTSWGMEMAFITKNGVGRHQTLPPPPTPLPTC